jgi:hypothetical protein
VLVQIALSIDLQRYTVPSSLPPHLRRLTPVLFSIDAEANKDQVQGRIELNGVMTDVDCDCSENWKVGITILPPSLLP